MGFCGGGGGQMVLDVVVSLVVIIMVIDVNRYGGKVFTALLLIFKKRFLSLKFIKHFLLK